MIILPGCGAKTHSAGFTLAELLIALAILGVIATFTIPKILNTQQNSQYKAVAKEAAGTISGAYSAYKLNNTVPSSMTSLALIPYFNYVRYDTVSVIDATYTSSTYQCSVARPCLKLHNGAMLYVWDNAFGGTSSSHLIWFMLDPDGRETVVGSTNGPGKSVWFALYYDGRMTTWADLLAGSQSNGSPEAACPTCDPPWFSWD